MADPADTTGVTAVDQGARAAQAAAATAPPDEEIIVRSDEDQFADMRQQIEKLEADAKAARDEAAASKRMADAARAREEAAATRAQTAEQNAERVRSTSENSVVDSQLAAIDNSITAHTEQMKSLKAQYKAAFTEGDADKIADLQADISRLAAQQVTLESGKAELEAKKAGRDAAVETPQTREGAPPDPAAGRENYIRQQPANLQAWLRGPNGDRFFRDGDFQRAVAGAAAHAQHTLRLSPDSDAFIAHVEEEVGLRQPAHREAEPAPRQNGHDTQQTRGRDAGDRMVTAPAGGSTPGTPRGGGTEVYLSAEEKAQARRDGITEAEYAKAKQELEREGLIGRNARNR